MKRTRRNGSGEKQEKEKENEQPIQADRPCHKVMDSLLSSKSGFHNYRGLLNDCIICLVLSSSHIILRNFDKYGLLIDPREWFYVMIQVINYSSAVLLALIWLFPALTFIMEVLASKFVIKEKVLFVFHTVNLFIFIITPVVVAFVSEPSPAGTFIVMLNYAIVWMKMVSYCHVNKWCRLSNNTTSNCTSNSTTGNGNSTVATGNSSNTSTGSKSAIVTYPNNLNVKDFIYFLFAPTLCYELNFPSSPSIRKMFLIRRTLEAVFLFNVLLALSQQWLAPTMLGSVEPFQKMNFIEMIQRILLLALPNHLMWLLMFYFFFHSFLNMLGEVMRFGDRCFYKDWWNADSISSFWRHWNVPVHRWASRHVYYPMIDKGYSKFSSQLAVFLLSAFFHEYLVSIPLRMLRAWAFTGMLSQIPLAMVTSLDIMRGQPGNVVVWVSIILGQPIAILMYMHDYYLINKLN